MASYRLPRNLDWVTPPSRCTGCNTVLSIRNLLPVVSWLLAGGKCGSCHQRVSIRYPLIELLTGLHFLLVYALYGLTPLMAILALFGVVLIIMLVADAETGLIPDEIHLALLPLGIVYHLLLENEWTEIMLSTALALGLGLLLHYGYYALRKKHGLGLGDVKFLAVAGLWLGALHPLVSFLFYSGFLGVITGVLFRLYTGQPRFPFGPALAISLFLLIIYPPVGEFFWLCMAWLLRFAI